MVDFKLLALFICFSTCLTSYGQKIIKSPNHYQIAIPNNWINLDKSKIDKILRVREEQSGIKTKYIVTEAIIVKSKNFSIPNIQCLFNSMDLNYTKFSEFITFFTKHVPEVQKVVLKNENISDKILRSDPSKPLVDYDKKMYLYVLKQEVAGIGMVIITSANFMANNGTITLNFTTKEADFDTYCKTIINILKSFKIDTNYLHL